MIHNKFFVPYSHNLPQALEINGHRLVIVSTDSDGMREGLDVIGGDEIREIEVEGDPASQEYALAELALQANGGVVLAPHGVSLRAMIDNLESNLPWFH